MELEIRVEHPVIWLDDPPLSRMQALVLRTIQSLGTEGYGQKVLRSLSHASGVFIDTSHVYTTIRKLAEKKLIKIHETRPQEGRRPALKVYKLTPLGLTALKTTAEHYQAVADFVSGKAEE